MNDTMYLQFVSLHRAEFDKAAKSQSWVFRMQIIVTLLSLITVFVENEVFVYITTIIALCITFAWAYFDWLYKKHRSVAERGRRVTLLAKGLDIILSDKECRDLLASFTATPDEAKKFEDPNYYANVKGKKGYLKLAGMLQESAFWSKHLLSASSSRYWSYFIIITILVVILSISLIPFLDDKTTMATAKIVTIMLTVLVSNDILGRAIAYLGAAQEVDKVYDRLERIKSSTKPENDLFFILSDYNSAIEGAPMFASGVYKKNEARLNKLWLNVNQI